MNFKSIFITGGAGFAGSCLVSELLKKSYKVTVYDIMYYTDNFLLKDNPNLIIPKRPVGYRETFALYMCLAENRDKLLRYLIKNGIEAKVHYPVDIVIDDKSIFYKKNWPLIIKKKFNIDK